MDFLQAYFGDLDHTPLTVASALSLHYLPTSKKWSLGFYFIVSGEISVYLLKIKVVSITSELISYHFTVFNFQIFNAARQLSHIEAAPDKSVNLAWWGLSRIT